MSGNDFKPFTETSGTSPYPHGQCTWYVYHRMNQFDASISGDLGDAHNWNNRAESEGYTVTHTPKNHTAVVFEAGQLGLIHSMVMLLSLKKLMTMVQLLFLNQMLKD